MRNVAETIIGAGVLLAAALFLVFLSQNTGLAARNSGDYAVIAQFRSAEGVVVGSDVRLGGVKVGTVTDLTLDPETYLAVTHMVIEDQIKIPDDSEAIVASEGLLGGAFIELSPGGSEFMLADGEEILSTQGAVSLLDLLVRYATSGTSE